ncbi:efflux RND transporter periplasmic adaptor subunit [Bartonella krasnovii]|uniref:Efflux RND transporter periplasmic adaptor subunit n=1 Tax=Bartonella krasnovii TaxID=2267275 RepID=A0A5B9D2X6_9HYPH|nr:efflux RND transporter periplasmic adaptor subunit [Bartonella krasnovii]QEE12868.1 efflux RND transporter periplasmic adaptor subunit [Bartonella krasnovii]UNF42055.1 efflux RND transporter periplasmic adaptor subunit [Bartonella krasnovii]UNF43710.1 efflux RND transporter periplasmic adaptor subunit [Bartonella krasnovii]UNF53563.1 efflux RND transporter periplasmic adaptor subunit [Bartonella krasnovii]UNF55261.1 efflux RND transporter periplasmic adaptor subunit [Bartonella krasnovii]
MKKSFIKNFITKRKKLSFFLISLFIIITFLWLRSAFFGTSTPTYMTAVVKRGDIEESVLASGIVRPYRLVAVGARTTGRVVSMRVFPGSVVKEGELLAEIDPTDQENDLKRKKAALAHYHANLMEQEAYLALAQKNLARQKKMIESRAVSKANFDDAVTQVKIREAQIAQLRQQIVQAQIDVESAEVNLGYTRITAPSAGTVLATVVEEGQNVNAVQSAPTIVILGDLSKMTVKAQISEADILKIRAGQPLYFTVLGNADRRYEGTLERVEPAPESIRADVSINPGLGGSSFPSSAIYYNGIVHVDNKDNFLRTYMTAQVHIILGRAQNVLLVPSDALRDETKEGKAWVSVLVRENKVVAKQVTVGLNNKVMAEIASGLDEGDVVITGSRDGVMPEIPDEHSEDEN